MAAFTLQDSQKVTLSVSENDAAGNPATGPTPSWTSSNTAVVTVTAAADGLSADAVAVGPEGTATVTVTVTPADGSAALTGSLDIDVVGGPATALTIAPGTPVAK